MGGFTFNLRWLFLGMLAWLWGCWSVCPSTTDPDGNISITTRRSDMKFGNDIYMNPFCKGEAENTQARTE